MTDIEVTTARLSRSPKRVLPVVLLLSLAGCKCVPPLVSVAPAQWVATPTHLVLTPTYVGQRTEGVVEVVNAGGARALAELALAAPFTVAPLHLELAKGEAASLVVTFAPTQAGPASAVLLVGTVEVQVEALGLEVPACLPSGVCADASFDFVTAQCLEAPKGEGAACETGCVTGGCVAGTCLGQLKNCGDPDECTIDACDEVLGCSHLPRVCPAPPTPCQVAKCDSATGCAVEDAPDGTLCGPDDCQATGVDVCIAGQCVRRARPGGGRCSNTWLAATLPAVGAVAMAYDSARQRMVLVSGGISTWEYDGTRWTPRFPPASPSARSKFALAYDAARGRVVLWGGEDGTVRLDDTWEWDGTTWLRRSSTRAPPARSGHALAYDQVRRRVVLFGGQNPGTSDPGVRADTWEWDGTNWTEATPTVSPPPTAFHAMAYDGARRRVVLFGGLGASLTPYAARSDTWEFDGVTWTQRLNVGSPPPRYLHAMAWEVARQRVVLFGGVDPSGALADTWEYDGASWTSRAPATAPPARYQHGLAYDQARRRTVVLGGSIFSGQPADTWEWDGTTWFNQVPEPSPPPRTGHAVVWDPIRQRTVMVSGFGTGYLADTWDFDGSRWSLRASGPAEVRRYQAALAFDAAQGRAVLFGGFFNVTGTRADTWEWDGTNWAQRLPVDAPPARDSHAMASDPATGRVVLFGGNTDLGSVADTWEWDSGNWVARAPATSPPARALHAMASDSARQRVVLFGGRTTTGALLDDTWEWDGTTWALMQPPTRPPARAQHSMAYDAARRRVVLLGGAGRPMEHWEWDGASWTQTQPAVLPRTLCPMVFDEARQRLTCFDGATAWFFVP